MLSYDEAAENLKPYEDVEPVNLDALAWGHVIGRIDVAKDVAEEIKDGASVNLADAHKYLEHFLGKIKYKDQGGGDVKGQGEYDPSDKRGDQNVPKLFDDLLKHNKSLLEDGSIEILLPDDDAALEERLRTLALWIEVFIAAIGASPHLKDRGLARKITPHLQDLIEMSKVDAASSADYDNPEEANIDFMEIYEFLRATIISLDLEFRHFVKQ